VNHHDSKMLALQDQFDAAERDGKSPDAGMVEVAASLARMGEIYGQMLKLSREKGEPDVATT